jgi:hypothetical protein
VINKGVEERFIFHFDRFTWWAEFGVALAATEDPARAVRKSGDYAGRIVGRLTPSRGHRVQCWS